MRLISVLLGVAVVLLGLWAVQQRREAHRQEQATQARLAAVSNDLQVAQAGLTQLQSRQGELLKQVSALEEARATVESQRVDTERQLAAVREELAMVRAAQAAAQDRATQEIEQLMGERKKLSVEVQTTREELSRLTQTHAATVEELTGLRERLTATEMELVSCNRRWNDLWELREQLRALKRKIAEERIAAARRQEERDAAAGNRGMLLQNGVWHTGKPGR